MKKNLLYLFALICSVSLFTACSDDDEKTDDSWKAVSATYSAETLKSVSYTHLTLPTT